MQDLEYLINFAINQINEKKIEYIDIEKTNKQKQKFKIKIIKNHLKKEKKTENPLKNTTNIKNTTNTNLLQQTENIIEESEDLGGFKIKFLDKKKFYIVSTLVGKIIFSRELNNGDIINEREKIAEIDILNIRNSISLNFKYKIEQILVANGNNVDYGKNIILAERIED